MPETLEYSAAVMIATFWLAARAAGLGVGWVSILDPVEVAGCWTLHRTGSWWLTCVLAGPRRNISIRSWSGTGGKSGPVSGGR